jgi:multisubunit Na+/H+ antiporter MnhC subunit
VSPNQPAVLFATLCLVTNQQPQLIVRRAARVLAVMLAVLVTGLTSSMSAAHADAPEQWEDTPPVAPLHAILVLAVIPIGLFLLITLLVYIPSMSKAQSYLPGQAWRGEPTWFGGPRGGLEAADSAAGTQIESGRPELTRGGASGRW